MTISAADALRHPLITDNDKIARIRDLLAPAGNSAQLWVLPLDSDGRQTPLLLPVEGRPELPDPATLDILLGELDALMGRRPGDAASFLFVLERLGPFGATEEDYCWSAALHGACQRASAACAGVFLLSPGGVMTVAP